MRVPGIDGNTSQMTLPSSSLAGRPKGARSAAGFTAVKRHWSSSE